MKKKLTRSNNFIQLLLFTNQVKVIKVSTLAVTCKVILVFTISHYYFLQCTNIVITIYIWLLFLSYSSINPNFGLLRDQFCVGGGGRLGGARGGRDKTTLLSETQQNYARNWKFVTEVHTHMQFQMSVFFLPLLKAIA